MRITKTNNPNYEEYDVFDNGRKIVLLWVNRGTFRASVQHTNETLYESPIHGVHRFYDDAERDYHLRWAVKHIQDWLAEPALLRERNPAPNVSYEIV